MKRLILALVVATLMALPTWLPAVEQIPDFSARYTVEKAGLNVISMTTSLKHSPGKLEYQSAAEPIGMAAWFSTIIEFTNAAILNRSQSGSFRWNTDTLSRAAAKTATSTTSTTGNIMLRT